MMEKELAGASGPGVLVSHSGLLLPSIQWSQVRLQFHCKLDENKALKMSERWFNGGHTA